MRDLGTLPVALDRGDVMKLTLGVIALGVLVGTLTGPVTSLAGIPDGGLLDGAWWQGVAEDTVRSFGAAASTALGLVAGAYGLREWQSRKDSSGGASG